MKANDMIINIFICMGLKRTSVWQEQYENICVTYGDEKLKD